MTKLKLLRHPATWVLGWLLLGLPPAAVLAADPVGAPGIDQEWRDRFVMGAYADGRRHARHAVTKWRAALKAAQSTGDLREELRAAAGYFANAIQQEDQAEDCRSLQRYVALARSGGPAFERELFDLGAAPVWYPFDPPCPGQVAPEELEALAKRLGDPARMFFVLEAMRAAPGMERRFGDKAALLSKQLDYTIASFQRGLVYWGIANDDLISDPRSTHARVWLERAQQELDPVEFRALSSYVDAVMAHVEFRSGNTAAALSAMQKALPAFRDGAADPEVAVGNVAYFAAQLTGLNRPGEALQLLEEVSQTPVIRPSLRISLVASFLRAYTQLGTPESYLKGEREIQRLQQSGVLERDSLTITPRVFEHMSLFYEKFGRFEPALQAQRRYTRAVLEAQRRGNEATRIATEAKLNVALKETENAQLKAQAELQAERQRGWIVAFCLAGAGAIASGGALTVAVRRGRRLARVSAQLEQRNGELEQRSASRIRLLAAACHDLRQPAHALGMLAELGGTAQQEPVRFSGWLQSVRRSTASLGEMLDELMDLGRLDGGHYTPLISDVPLGELMQEVMLHFGPLARRKGLTLLAPPVTLQVGSDRHLLRRILFNLVSNAIKYTDAGEVQVRLTEDGDRVRLSVEDSGPGIPQDKIDEVFRDYVRLNPSKATEGLGIGLSIVRRAAELLGHELTLQSTPGQGTCVSLTLPVIRAALAPAADAEVLPAETRAGVVAVIENDLDVREAMASLLESWGYTVCAGADAAAVLALATEQAQPVELVITDLHLDNTDGLAEVARLREALEAPGLPALLVTGDLDGAVTGQAASLGVYVAHKPLAPRKLAALVGHLLETPLPERSPSTAPAHAPGAASAVPGSSGR